MVASTNDFPRLVIRKGVATAAAPGLACFATHFYTDEGAEPEDYVLTIDEQMACSLNRTEQRVSVRDMCRRFFEVLCTDSSDCKLV